MSSQRSSEISLSFSLLGILPLVFFGVHLKSLVERNVAAGALWVCNASNLLLGFGLLVRIPELIRVAFLWLFSGLPLWFFEMYLTGEGAASAFLTHWGGMCVAMWGVFRVRMSRHAWWHALTFFFGLQVLSRWCTPPELNVNVAHRIRDEARPLVSTYRQYWMLTSGVSLLVIKKVADFFLACFQPNADHRGC